MYGIDLGYSWNPYFLDINEDSIKDMFKLLSCLDDKDWRLLFKNANFTPDKALLNNNKSINKKALLDYLVKMFNSEQSCSLVFHIYSLCNGFDSYDSAYKIDFDNKKMLKVLLKNYKKYHFYYIFFNKSLLKIKIINAKPDITEFELVNSECFKLEELPDSCKSNYKQTFGNRPYIINIVTQQPILVNFKLRKIKANTTNTTYDLLTFEEFSKLNQQIMNTLEDENIQPCVWCSPSNEKGAKRKCPRCKKILEDLKQLIKFSYIATHENATKRKIAEYVEYEIKQLNLEMSKITYENLLKIYRKNNGFESVEIEIDKFDFFLLENELKKYKEKEKSGSLINKGEKIYLFILELVHAMYKKEEEKEDDDEEEKSVSIKNIDEESNLWIPDIMLEVYKKKEKCLLDFYKNAKLKEDYFDNFDYRELEELKKSDKMKQYYRLCRSLSQTISSVFSTKWTNL